MNGYAQSKKCEFAYNPTSGQQTLILHNLNAKLQQLCIRVDSRDPQTSNIPIRRYHCLGEVAFLKI